MRKLITQFEQGTATRDGYISLENGFLNPSAPESSFPQDFNAWDVLLENLSSHIWSYPYKTGPVMQPCCVNEYTA